MKIQVLVSTMNQKHPTRLAKDMRIREGIVINQITKSDFEPEDLRNGPISTYSYIEKGLSRSRNRAFGLAKADVCLIADDDMYYEENYEATVLKAYDKYSNADIIVFYVDNEDKKLAAKKQKEGRIGFLKSMKVVSYQISFRREIISSKNIKMDQNFGTGTENYMGEESIFLFDALKKGLKIYYVPKKIATLRKDSVSTWFEGYTAKFFMVKGKVFYSMSKPFSPFLAIQFAVRKRSKFIKYSWTTAFFIMIKSIIKEAIRR